MFETAWLASVAASLGLKVDSYELDAALHEHPSGSRSGWLHNDYNPGWFRRPALKDEVVFSESGECNYKAAVKPGTSPEAILRARHIAMIYFLSNDWSPGDGGETGLFSHQSQNITRPDILVSPKNNRLIAFECSPHSYHAFISTKKIRRSIILWMHTSTEETRNKWPKHELVQW